MSLHGASNQVVRNFAGCAAVGVLTAQALLGSPLEAEQSAISVQERISKDKGVADTIAKELAHVFAKASPAVVKVYSQDRHGAIVGTGFFVDPSGVLYTAYSVGGESADLDVEVEGRKYPAKRLVADPHSGIAILKIEAETPFLPLGNGDEVRIASPVLAIGYPLDLDVTPSFGLVAGFDIHSLGRFFSTTHIRANVPVQRGQGGAPLLNLHGEVIGILVSAVDGGSGCYALPIAAAEKIRMDYVRFGEVHPGWLGLVVTDEESSTGNSTKTVIRELLPSGPVAGTGLREGDALTRVGTHSVNSTTDLLDASFFLTAGDEVAVTVQRDGKDITFQIHAGEHPQKTKLQAGGPLQEKTPFGIQPKPPVQ